VKLIIMLEVDSDYVMDGAIQYLGQKIVQYGKTEALSQFPRVKSVEIEKLVVLR
jgi:hypothetical protein